MSSCRWDRDGEAQGWSSVVSGGLGVHGQNQGLSIAFLSAIFWWRASGHLSHARCWEHGGVRPHHQATGEETNVAPKISEKRVG